MAQLDGVTWPHLERPLVVSTQLANEPSLRVLRKLGFTECERHEEYGEAQWFGAVNAS